MKNLVVILIMMIGTIGPAMVIAAVGFASIRALGRNPSSSPKIMLALVISMIFATAVAVVALLVIFHVFSPS